MPVIFIAKNKQKGEIDSGENCHEENTRGGDEERRGRRSRNNKNANDLRPGRDDKGIKTENKNKQDSEIKFF